MTSLKTNILIYFSGSILTIWESSGEFLVHIPHGKETLVAPENTVKHVNSTYTMFRFTTNVLNVAAKAAIFARIILEPFSVFAIWFRMRHL
jgi:hypothetical protein